MNVTYVVSEIDKSLHFEWIVRYLDPRFTLRFVLIGKPNTHLQHYLMENGIKTFVIPYESKSELPKVGIRLFFYLIRFRPEVIHTHLFVASAIGLFVSKLLRVKRRIYTRHHGSIHHRYFPRAVKYDRLINFLATDIVVLSENQRKILLERENAPSRKLHLIYHGFDLRMFGNAGVAAMHKLRLKHGIPEGKKYIGAISRFTHWKGVQYTIQAFRELIIQDDRFHLILANAVGDYEDEISKLLNGLPPNSHTLITFEADIGTLYQLFDYFVHVPIDPYVESFGQTYVESLASNVPGIFTLSGVAADFIRNGEEALIVPFESIKAIVLAIMQYENDPGLKTKIIESGNNRVGALFGIEQMINKLTMLYGTS